MEVGLCPQRPAVLSHILAPRLLPLTLPLPPNHPFQIGAIGVRTWNPIADFLESWFEVLPHFLSCRPKGRPISIWNEIVDGKKLTPWFEASINGTHVLLPLFRINRTKKGMLEHPVVLLTQIV